MNGTLLDRDEIAQSEAVDRVETAAGSNAGRSVGGLIDGLLAVALLALGIVVGQVREVPESLGALLRAELSVKNVLLLGAFGVLWPNILRWCGLDARARWRRIAPASVIGGIIAGLMPFGTHGGTGTVERMLFFATTVAPATVGYRALVRGARRVRRGARPRNILIVGSGRLAARAFELLRSDDGRVNHVLGFVDSEPQPMFGAHGPPHLGRVADLDRILMHRVVDDVLICLPIKSRYTEIEQALAACMLGGVPAEYSADLFRSFRDAGTYDGRLPAPVLKLRVAPNDGRLIVKRLIDVLGAAVLLALVSPLLVAIAVLIKATSEGPILFSQERHGHMKRRFRMLKFRTMVADAERLQATLEAGNEASGPIFKIREDPRMTRVGRFLRRSSLDELPQLWHVLNGEMSLVGPRPMSVRDVSRFEDPWIMRRFSMRPGLTCLWQVSGRSNLTFDRWVALDLEYIDNWSLSLDLLILAMTIPAVISGEGAQ